MRSVRRFIVSILGGVALVLTLAAPCAHATSSAAALLSANAGEMFKIHHPAVVQVRVVRRGSGEKTTLGSGFYFSAEGRIATNYHVVAEAIISPQEYAVEYLTVDGLKANAEVVAIDPAHDLAILGGSVPENAPLILGDSQLSKGDRIYAFGNPHDLGMIIVEGLFNGLVEKSRYRKILFSGALNPGMSGGPALGEDGRVLGVNVATAGNDLSFIIPVEFLVKLDAEPPVETGSGSARWTSRIRQSVLNEQTEFLDDILSRETWSSRPIGGLNVPAEIAESFHCWDVTGGERKDNWVIERLLSCAMTDGIYISERMSTAEFYFDYEWYQSRSRNPWRFYNIFERYAANRAFDFRNADFHNVTNFTCEQSWIDLKGARSRLEFCARRYLYYEDLFDVSIQVLTADSPDSGGVINIYALGVSEDQSLVFMKRFLKEVSWNE